MDTIQKGIITLIKSAVTQQPLELPEGFSMEEAYTQIRRHSLITLAYDGAVRCGIPKTEPVMQKLFQGYVRAMQISEGQLRQVERICKAFDENGIDYMPLKGCNMKRLYPAPELRAMGDADILIRVEQYDEIERIMGDLGYQAGVVTDYEIVWNHPQLHLELHRRLISTLNEDYYAYLGDGWNRAIKSAGVRYAMRPEDEFIYELIHFAKHFRNGGIGCRHVTDLWIYQKEYPAMDSTYLTEELTKLQLLDFYRTVQRLIDVWFEHSEPDDQMEFLTTYIFESGNWGKAESHFLSTIVKDKRNKTVNELRREHIRKHLFPPASAIEKKYTILKKAPWLLPLVWIYRPFYKLLFERRSLKRQLDNVKLVSEEKIDAKRQMLRSVGLDFNF